LYLGHVINNEGVLADKTKIAPILKWQRPDNVKALRSFLGMTEYYRKFIKGYGVISKNLTQLFKKGVPYIWNSEREESFQALKLALSSTPVLEFPDFTQIFVIETDACSRGIGAVLLQNSHPIVFLSKALGPKHRGLSTYEKECLAILRIDQRSLTHLDDKRLTTQWQHKALTKLFGLSYKIVYKKGVDNRVADALSRHIHSDTEELLMVSDTSQTYL
jgi:hypothetical protein